MRTSTPLLRTAAETVIFPLHRFRFRVRGPAIGVLVCMVRVVITADSSLPLYVVDMSGKAGVGTLSGDDDRIKLAQSDDVCPTP